MGGFVRGGGGVLGGFWVFWVSWFCLGLVGFLASSGYDWITWF